MRIGVVDLDTSHPGAWVPIERELGHEVVGVYDPGQVRPPGFAAEFAKEHAIPRVFTSLADMAREVDCAIIHSCDWGLHVERARPFVDAGKAVLIDKPVAGSLRDLRQFVAWAGSGARIAGGSSLRFCNETREWLAKDAKERGTPHTVLCGCGVDEFNYGIHAYAQLSGIMGAGIRGVRHLGKNVQHHLQVTWSDGRMGLLVVGAQEAWLPFYASVTTEKLNHQFQADATKLYRALLEAALPYLSGKVEKPAVSIEALIEPELAALAARQSWMNGDREVRLSELSESDPGYDGAAFAREYRKRYA